METETKKGFIFLFRRLCKIGHLFHQGNQTSTNKVTYQIHNILTKSKPSPFHHYVIHFCIEHELSNLLQVYLDFYELILTPESLKLFNIELIKPWIQLFFDFRFHNQLFKTSITYSQLLLEVIKKH